MLKEIVKQSVTALLRSPTRTALTMLGIVWGTVAVALLVAYGSSFRSVMFGAFDAFKEKFAAAAATRPSFAPRCACPRRTGSSTTSSSPAAANALCARHACGK